jgi:hypothetical protein
LDAGCFSACGAEAEGAMERYFFHMRTKDKRYADVVGREFSSLGQAHEHAVRLIDKTMKFVGQTSERWIVEVYDSSGDTVLAVLFPAYSWYCIAPYRASLLSTWCRS